MRARLFLLLAVLTAACERPDAPPADTRQPVSILVRAGEFIRAEYVDSALMASPGLEPEARARARALWLRYGSPGMDSVVIRVSDHAELAPGVDQTTLFFAFTPGELGGAADGSAASSGDDPSRPVELEVRSGHVRAVYVDPVLAGSPVSPDQSARLRALGRQVLRQLEMEADSVTVAVTDGAIPERTRVWSTFPRAVLREGR